MGPNVRLRPQRRPRLYALISRQRRTIHGSRWCWGPEFISPNPKWSGRYCKHMDGDMFSTLRPLPLSIWDPPPRWLDYETEYMDLLANHSRRRSLWRWTWTCFGYRCCSRSNNRLQCSTYPQVREERTLSMRMLRYFPWFDLGQHDVGSRTRTAQSNRKTMNERGRDNRQLIGARHLQGHCALVGTNPTSK